MVNDDFFLQMKIRVPSDLKEWLEKQAKKNIRSQNAEIVFVLREKMERQNQKASDNEKTV